MCNQVGEAVGRIYLNIDREDIEAYLANHPEVLPLNTDQDVFDFPRFQVRMFVNQGGVSFAPIPPPDEDEYVDDDRSVGFAEVDWAVPHLELRVRVNQNAFEITRYIDDRTDSSSDDDTDEEISSDDASHESSDSNDDMSDEDMMFYQ